MLWRYDDFSINSRTAQEGRAALPCQIWSKSVNCSFCYDTICPVMYVLLFLLCRTEITLHKMRRVDYFTSPFFCSMGYKKNSQCVSFSLHSPSMSFVPSSSGISSPLLGASGSGNSYLALCVDVPWRVICHVFVLLLARDRPTLYNCFTERFQLPL